MILHDLVKRYEDKKTAGEEVSFGWEKRKVSFAIDISSDGELLGLVPLTDDNDRPREFVLPKANSRTSTQINPSFLCENAQYLFGLIDEDKATKDNKLSERKQSALMAFGKTAELHKSLIGNINNEFSLAILNWFSNWKPEEVSGNSVIAEAFSDSKVKKRFFQGTFVFMINGCFASEDKDLYDIWEQEVSKQETAGLAENGSLVRCLVTGEMDLLEEKHGSVGSLIGAQATAPLISVNSASFASYGKTEKDAAAQIGIKAAFAYRAALVSLLKDNKHQQRIGADTIVYWADDNGEQEAEVFSWALQPKEEGNDLLDSLMRTYAQGLPIDIDGVDSAKGFHILALSPNAGRISVRFYIKDSFDAVISNLIKHYENLKIVAPKNDRFPFLPPWVLISETTVTKKSGDAVPLLAGQLLNSILTGQRYPLTFYSAIIGRAKSNENVNKTKAAIIKAVLLRNFQESEVATVALNNESNNVPYVLGRLFATLEHLQKQASGGALNATIKDKYFSSACSNPGSVFPILLKLSMHHAAKLDNAVYYEKLKTDLLGRLDDQKAFPAAMNLEDQGKFILGYYHQTQHFYTPKDGKENTNNKED